MGILDPNTLAAARGVATSTLADTAMIYTPQGNDNGLATEITYALRDTQACRVVAVRSEDESNALQLLNKQLFRVTMGAGSTINLNEQVVVSGSVNVTGIVVENLSQQTDDNVAVQFVMAQKV